MTSYSIDAILRSLPGDKSPLLLLLAFSAAAVPRVDDGPSSRPSTGDGAPPLSRYALYNTICTQAVRRKLTERWHQTHPLDCDEVTVRSRKRLMELEASAVRLLACYAMARHLSRPDALARLPGTLGPHMAGLFGDDAYRMLLHDLDDLSGELKVGFRSDAVLALEPASLLPAVLEQLSGLLTAGSADTWAFVHKSFEEFYRGVALSEMQRTAGSVYDAIWTRSAQSVFRELFPLRRASTDWRAPLDFAAFRAGPQWLLRLFVSNLSIDLPEYLQRLARRDAEALKHFISTDVFGWGRGELLLRCIVQASPAAWLLLPGLPSDGVQLLKDALQHVSAPEMIRLQCMSIPWQNSDEAVPLLLLQIRDEWTHNHATKDRLLSMAARRGFTAVVAYVLQHGSMTISAQRLQEWCLFTVATGRLETLKLLLTFAPPQWHTSLMGGEMLIAAANSSHLYMLEFLLYCGVDVNYAIHRAESNNTVTALAAAAAVDYGSVEIVRLLIQCGAHIESRDQLDWTPLMIAARARGSVPRVTALIESKADVNAFSADSSPLIAAAFHAHADTVRVLLDAKADPNIVCPNGETPLAAAITAIPRSIKDQCECISTLVARGANISHATKHSNGAKEVRLSPLSMAVLAGVDHAVISTLLALGASPSVTKLSAPLCFKHLRPMRSVPDNSNACSLCFSFESPVVWQCACELGCSWCADCGAKSLAAYAERREAFLPGKHWS